MVLAGLLWWDELWKRKVESNLHVDKPHTRPCGRRETWPEYKLVRIVNLALTTKHKIHR